MAQPVIIGAELRLQNPERAINEALRRINPVIKARIDAQSIRAVREPLGQITKQANEFQKSLEAANARVIAFGASVGVLSAAYRGFTNLVRITIDVEKSLANINVVLNTTDKGLENISKKLFDIAKNTGQTFRAAADAATELARQGLSAEETLKRVNDALVLTRLSGLDAASSVETLTATVNGFAKAGLTTTTIINKLANVDAAFAVSSRDLAEGLSRVGSSAQEAGVSFDELLAIITSVQQTTARGGAVIGNSLKTIFTRIGRRETLKDLEDLGVAVRDASDATLPAIQILQNLARTYEEVGDTQRKAIAEQVGGVYQINILQSALRDLSKEYSIYGRALDTALSSTDQAYRRNIELNKTLSSLVNATTQSIVEFANEIGKISVAPALRNVIEVFNEFLGILRGEGGLGSVIGPLIQSLATGLASIFTGPGLVVAVGTFAKLVARAVAFGSDALKVILAQNGKLENQKRIQAEINAILRSDNGEYARQLASLDSIAAKQQYITNIIRERSRLNALSNAENSAIAARIGRNFTLGDEGLKKRFPGFYKKQVPNYSIPNFAKSGVPNYLPTNMLSAYRQTLKGIKSGPIYFDPNLNRGAIDKKYYTQGYYDRISDNIVVDPKRFDQVTLAHESVHRFINKAKYTTGLEDLSYLLNDKDNPEMIKLIKNQKLMEKGYGVNDALEESIARYGVLGDDTSTLSKLLKVKPKTLDGLYNKLERASFARIMRGGFKQLPPNFADPLQAAVQREITQGKVSRSQIRVEQHPSLIAPHNPAGLAVTNTRDEPNGIGQGIARARAEGRNPKTYNIPGFAQRKLQLSDIYSLPPNIREVLLKTFGDGNDYNSILKNLNFKNQKALPTLLNVIDQFKFRQKSSPKQLNEFISQYNSAATSSPIPLGPSSFPIGPSQPPSVFIPPGGFYSNKNPRIQVKTPLDRTSAERSGRVNLDEFSNQYLKGFGQGSRDQFAGPLGRNFSRFDTVRQTRAILQGGAIPENSQKYFATLARLTDPTNKSFTDIAKQSATGSLNRGGSIQGALSDAADSIRRMGATTEQINKISERLAPALQEYKKGIDQNNRYIKTSLGDLNRSRKISGIEARLGAGENVSEADKRYLTRIRQRQFLTQQATNVFGPQYNQFSTEQKIQAQQRLRQDSEIQKGLAQIKLGIEKPQGFTKDFEQFIKQQRFGRTRAFFSRGGIEEQFLDQLKRGNPNIDIDSTRDALRQRRIENKDRLQGRLFMGSFLASAGAGLLQQSESPTTRGAGTILQSAATGASFGLFGGPIAAAVGGGAGALIGAYKAINDTSAQFEKLNESIQRNIDQNTKLVNSTQNFVQIQSQISDAIREGASEADLQQFFEKAQSALRDINDPDTRRRLVGATGNPDAINRILADVSRKFEEQSKRNDVILSVANLDKERDRVLEIISNRSFSGERLKTAGQALAAGSKFKTTSELGSFIEQSLKDPQNGLNKFKDKLGLTGKEVEQILETFAKYPDSFKVLLNEFGNAAKENIEILSLSRDKQGSQLLSKRLDVILGDINRQIQVENKIREINTGFTSRLIDAFSSSQNTLSLESPIAQIDRQLKGQLLTNSISTGTASQNAIRGGLGGVLKGLEDTPRNKELINAINDILGGKKGFNLSDLLSQFGKMGDDITGALKDIDGELQVISAQSRATSSELKIISDLNKVQVINEQKNRVLDAGGFNQNRNADIQRAFQNLSRTRSRGNELEALENALGSLESLGITPSERDRNELRNIRVESTRQSFSDLLSRLTGSRVGATSGDIENAASALANVSGKDSQSQALRLAGRRILTGNRLLDSDPQKQLDLIKNSIQTNIAKGGTSILQTEGIGLDTKGLLLSSDKLNTSIQVGFKDANKSLNTLTQDLDKIRVISEEIASKRKQEEKEFNANTKTEAARRAEFSPSRLNDINTSEIAKILEPRTRRDYVVDPVARTASSTVVTAGSKITDALSQSEIKVSKELSLKIDKYIRNNASQLGSNEFFDNFISKFQEEFTKQNIITPGPEAISTMRKMTEDFVKILMDSIIDAAANNAPIIPLTEAQRVLGNGSAGRSTKRSAGLSNELIDRLPAPTILSKKGSVGRGSGSGIQDILDKYDAKVALENSINEATSQKANATRLSDLKKAPNRLGEFNEFGEGFSDYFESAQRQILTLRDIGLQTAAALEDGFANAFGNFVTGTKSAGDAFRSFAASVLSDLSKMFVRRGTQQLFDAISNSNIGGSIGKIFKFAQGGKVPALLTGGEFVVAKNQAQRMGYGNLNKINKKYADGGLVTGGSGVRDDVPALLSPGDFVMKKSAVPAFFSSIAQKRASGGSINDVNINDLFAQFRDTSYGYNPNAASAVGTASGGSVFTSETSAMSGAPGAVRSSTAASGQNFGATYGSAIINGLFQIGSALYAREKQKGPHMDLVKRSRELRKQRRAVGPGGTLIYGRDGQIMGYGKVSTPIAYNQGGLVTGGEAVIPSFMVRKVGANNLRRYNEGGMVNAVGSYNSAQGSNQAGSITVSINNTFNNDSETGSETSGKESDSEFAKKLNERIKSVVLNTIQEEKRNGGSLNSKNGR